MAMTLHVVIPPHPLIGHWLSILRIDTTPPAIYATALEQLGKWLTYEALRDWIPIKKEKLTTRDPRAVERKKYGHRKARRSFQFSKR